MVPRLSTQAGVLAGSRAIGQIANAAVSMVVVRYLSQHDFGTFRQIYLLLATLMVLADLGFCESLYYFLPRFPEKHAAYLRRAFLVVGSLQVGVGAALYGMRGALGRYFNNEDLPAHVGMLAVALGLTVVTRLWEYQLIAQKRILPASLVSGGYEIFKVALMLTALAVSPTVGGLLLALVISSAVKFLAYLWFLLREYRWFVGVAADEDAWMQLRYALALGVPAIFNVAATQAHQYIVSFHTLPEEFAIYSVACFQVPIVGVLSTSIIEVMLVRITEARAQNRLDEVKNTWLVACTRSLLIFVPIAVGLAALSRPLIEAFFTRNYLAAAPLFALLMAALPLSALFTDNILRAFGEMRSYSAFYVSRLILVLVLGILGVKLFGLWGAATSGVLALAIVKGSQLRKVAELLETSVWRVLPWSRIARISAAAVIAAVPVYFFGRAVTPAWVGLTAGVPLYAAIYLLLAYSFGLIAREEVKRAAQDLASFLGIARAAGVKAP